MEGAEHHETGPAVRLEQAVELAKQHTWSRVGFTIGVITYAMATLWAQRELDLAYGTWLVIFASGTVAISGFGLRWHASAKAIMASATVVDADGNAMGRADQVAKREIQQRVINLWRVGHKTSRPRQVVGDDAPITTHRPRERRGAPRRRR